MDPSRLRPEVELPVRRTRPLALGAGVALLFALGARNYVASVRPEPRAADHEIVRLELISDPPGATVERVRDRHVMCVAPCAVGVEAEPGVSGFRFALAGHHDRTVLVNLSGGDTRVETVLEPLGTRATVYFRGTRE
jgi:hypothetical protein